MRRPNRIRVSDHFSLEEFQDPTTRTVMLDGALLIALEKARAHFDAPIRVTSGYRTVQHNADVGGVPNSEHTRGRAADLVPLIGPMDDLDDACRSVPELLVINEGDHIHVELRPDIP